MIEEGDSTGKVDSHRNKINITNTYSNKKNNKLKVAREVEVDVNDEVVDNESAVVGVKVLREKAL